MVVVTVTAVTTISDFVGPPSSSTTTTISINTVIPATPGQTITFTPEYLYTASGLKYTPTFIPTQTYTVTEYDVYIEGSQSNIWTEVVIDTSPTDISNPNSPYSAGDMVFVVPCPCSGWSCWSAGRQAGLIVGVVGGVLFILLLLCCLRSWRKRKVWICHGPHGATDYERWQNSHPGWGYYGPPNANLNTGWGLRPYVTSAQAEAALRGGVPGPAPAAPAGVMARKEESKKEEPKGARQKLGKWIAG